MYNIRICCMIKQLQMNNNQLNVNDRQKILKYFTDKNLTKLLYIQLKQMYQDQISQKYMYTIAIQCKHFYIYVQAISKSQKKIALLEDYPSTYCIKITKSFPLSGVRVYLLKHYIHPRINDGRDLLHEMLNAEWTYKKKLLDIIYGISTFQQKLLLRHEKFISVQKTGKFQIGDTFTRHQLSKFSALDIYADSTKPQYGALICISQTHMIILKSIASKVDMAPNYQTHRVCDLQCIDSISHRHHTNEVIITVTKYKVDNSFNQYQKLKKKYTVDDAEDMIRKILKNIGKFQRCQIDLKTCSQWHEEKGFNDVYLIIKSSQKLQTQLDSNANLGKQKKQVIFMELNKKYQSIIEYFSSRGDSYHHIYVNKLNNLYALHHY